MTSTDEFWDNFLQETLTDKIHDANAEVTRLTADLQAAHAVIAEMQARHQRLGRPHLASCTCGKVICPDLTLLDKIILPSGEVE